MKHERYGVRWGGIGTCAGFSLIEMLVVMAVILVLLTLYWSPSKGSRQRGLQIACQRNLERVFLALEIYANEHAGKFPALAGARTSEEALAALVPQYTSDTAAFICPASTDTAPPGGIAFRKARISYAYYMGRSVTNAQQVLMSDAQVDTQPKVPGQPVFSSTGNPPGNNHRQAGGNFLFGDGHVNPSPATAAFSLGLEPGVVLLNP
jgi:prepilin-type N-terminal cleavage/methylation domain-containing protein/prepilin-type processing-associated H-X9-DG protein